MHKLIDLLVFLNKSYCVKMGLINEEIEEEEEEEYD